jgi:hypothetical protein
MPKTNQEKPSGNKHSDVVKITPEKIKNGEVSSAPPPKPVKPDNKPQS